VISVHDDLIDLADLIRREQDVRQVIALQPLGDGRALFVIETPFMTFPKFVVGSTNEHNDDVRILMSCGARWSAESAFDEILNPGGAAV
jgi:hypothetical protein